MKQEFLPKRIILTTAAKGSPKAIEVANRIRQLDPNIPTVDVRSANNDRSWRRLSVPQRWKYRKESIILAERGEPFITTFASPGKIVEDIGTLLNLTFHCASDCEFCYLQTVMPPAHIIYTNVARLESEIAVEPFAHRAILTLWTVVSFAQRQRLLKIPHNFNVAAGYLREQFQGNSISKDEDAIELLYHLMHSDKDVLYKKFLTKKERKSLYGIGEGSEDEQSPLLKKSCFRLNKKRLAHYYSENKKYRPRLNTSEFTDFIAIDHLANNAPQLMNLLHKYPDFELGFRTKSAFVDELLSYDGDNRVRIAINFNTEHVINKYEHCTATLSERLLAAKKVQQAKGFGLKVVVEPIIIYPGWIEDYSNLIDKIIKTIKPNQVVDYTFGTVRYGKKLQQRIIRNFSTSDLFDSSQSLSKPEGDTKMRYDEKKRVEVYTAMFKQVRGASSNSVLRLSAESESLWDMTGLDKDKHLGKSVFQFSQLKAAESEQENGRERRKMKVGSRGFRDKGRKKE